MFRNNSNTFWERIFICLYLLRYGIVTNLFSGKISYYNYQPVCKCSALRLLRHGKTLGVENKEFMSNNSHNSVISAAGVEEIKNSSDEVISYLPDITIVSPLGRTVSTFYVLQKNLPFNLKAVECPFMIGINNSNWESKTLDMLDTVNYKVYYEREYNHNIFAKSFKGDSWGDVLIRCGRLLAKLNNDYSGQKVLLISQGSVLHGIKILLHKSKSPWSDYSSGSMFSNTNSNSIGYGKVFQII